MDTSAKEGDHRLLALEAQALTRDFGNGRGIFDLSLRVYWGKIVSILGANGSGKTTLVRCLSLFEPIDSGRIIMAGTSWADRNGLLQSVQELDKFRGSWLGTVFQQSDPWPHLTVLHNILLPLRCACGLSVTEAHQRAEESLASLGLLDRADSLPRELSGGLRQRVCLARALALRPRILLVDEVTSALDPDWTEQVRLSLRAFADRGGIVVNVSHRVGFVRRLSDQVLFLDGGRIVEEGEPGALLDNPKTPKLQRFLENA